jgi:hypothetical protein
LAENSPAAAMTFTSFAPAAPTTGAAYTPLDRISTGFMFIDSPPQVSGASPLLESSSTMLRTIYFALNAVCIYQQPTLWFH